MKLILTKSNTHLRCIHKQTTIYTNDPTLTYLPFFPLVAAGAALTVAGAELADAGAFRLPPLVSGASTGAAVAVAGKKEKEKKATELARE